MFKKIDKNNKKKLVKISFITDMNNDILERVLDALMDFGIFVLFRGRDAVITTERYEE